jgi:predicted permease
MKRLLGDAWHPDMAETMRKVCADARRRHGVAAGAAAWMAESFDLLRVAIRVRLGLKTPVTGGWQPRGPKQRRNPMQTLTHDLRLAVRSLLSTRVPSAIAIGTLALGIGVSTAVFSVLDSVLIRPMPYQSADRLTEIWSFNEQRQFRSSRLNRGLFLDWRRQHDLFERVEGYEIESAIYAGPRGAEMVSASFVTPGLLPMLGVAPLEGRLLGEGDGRDGTDDRVVISERFWREALQRDPEVVGRMLTFNGRPHEVVGIMPAAFRFPNSSQLLWFPLDAEQPPAARMTGTLNLTAFARIRADLTLQQVSEQVTLRGAALSDANGGRPNVTAVLHDKGAFVDTRVRQSLLVLAGAVGFLLLIVCANTANLSLSRALTRSRDLAVRASLGASRRDLIRESFVENLLIGVSGTTLGVLIAWVTLTIGVSYLPQQITFSSVNVIDLDTRVLLFAAAAGLLTPILFGLPTAVMASRPNVASVLRNDARTASGSTAARRVRGLLVIAEVTVAIVLLVGAALMARSLYQIQAVDRGFDTSGLMALRVGLPAQGYLDPYARDGFSDALIERLRGMPGVTAVTAGGIPPDSSQISVGKIEFAHALDATTEQSQIIPIYSAWPGYFEAVGLALKEGRGFVDGDTSDTVVIGESFARDFWPGQSPIGGQFRFTGSKAWKTVIGVATDVRQFDLDDRMGSYEWFQPLRTPPGRVLPEPPDSLTAIIDYRTFVVRANNPAVVMTSLADAVHATDSRVVIWETKLVDDMFAEAIERPRVVLFALIIFAALGLTLAAAGLYGVLSHLVTQRMREFGIRLALGARPAGVFRLIIRSGLTLTGIGLVAGLGAAVLLARTIQSMLYQVESFDPLALFGVSAVLLVTAVLACWRPARRAMRVDPVSLLREQ